MVNKMTLGVHEVPKGSVDAPSHLGYANVTIGMVPRELSIKEGASGAAVGPIVKESSIVPVALPKCH